MESHDLLDTARREFATRLEELSVDHHGAPTPATLWNVRDLISHVVGGNVMAVNLLAGASAAEAMDAITNTPLGPDAVESFRQSADAQAAAFAAPGALSTTVHHPIGDVSGEQLLGFRVMDMTLHAWDLARATDLDETLDGSVLEYLWEMLSPLAPVIGTLGLFGEGPSGDVGDDAPLQQRVLDLTGRRP